MGCVLNKGYQLDGSPSPSKTANFKWGILNWVVSDSESILKLTWPLGGEGFQRETSYLKYTPL